jgi:GTPase Era involved in 16S rRNA processing
MNPEFAIMGHPNEGKSSVLSTLAEDDSVRISSRPGETVQCRTFPVTIDGEVIISFTDTPGFQNPGRMLSELKKYSEAGIGLMERFYREYRHDPDLEHDCELLRPLLRGAGIIYVADGSRPIRNVDIAEMEILRLSGKPRMAILNCKTDDRESLERWKTEFRKHFNSSRIFNAHRATYRERIRLLEALKSIEQDWQESLDYVVTTFKNDWQSRNNRAADIICEMISAALRYTLQNRVAEDASLEQAKEKLFRRYQDDIKKLEQKHHLRLKKLYKHNIFDYRLPSHSILHQDLFSSQTWEFLGLKRSQLALAGGAGGAALAAGLDIAAGGSSLGIFTSIGGALGALGALYGSKNIASKIKVLGIDTGKVRIDIGPNKNPQFPYILLDRALLYYSHIINWAHGRRDYDTAASPGGTTGLTRELPRSSLKKIGNYFRALLGNADSLDLHEKEFKQTVLDILTSISNADDHESDTLN